MVGKLGKEDRHLWRTVLRTLRPFPFTSSKTILLIGVSGGADSLALLHLLWQQLGTERLVVAHLNHNLRPDANDDAHFVEQTAVSWQIPFVGKKLNVADVAESGQLSLEAAGRLMRYRFFARQAEQVGATAVVVAHHADDQAETLLLHLLRGSGSAGLRGMLPVSQMPESEGVPLLRPFLNVTRAEIETYCTRHGLEPRTDDSNEDVQFARNRIRHELLPLLQTYNPQIAARLQQLATITADEYDAQLAQFNQVWPEIIMGAGDEWLVADRQKVVELPVAWQRLALRRVVERLRPFHTEVSFQTIEQARTLIFDNQSGTEATLPGGLLMQVEATEILFGTVAARQSASVPQLNEERPVLLPVPGKLNLGHGWQIVAETQSDVALDAIRHNDDPWLAFVALAEGDALWIRPSLPEERFQPLGMAGHSQAIQDLLSDRKVARGKRPLWPIVATAQYPVWIVGQHLDERVRVTEKSRHVVRLHCQPNVAE